MKANQKYAPEFRAEAVKLVLEQGLTQPEAAERLGIPKGSLPNWVVTARRAGIPPMAGAPTVAELQAENARLREGTRPRRDGALDRKKGRRVLLPCESLQGTRS